MLQGYTCKKKTIVMENIFDKKSENIRNFQVLYHAFCFENERTIQILPKGKSELQYDDPHF